MKKVKRHDWPKAIRQIQAKGLTQSDIEKKTGVKQADISKLLNGKISDVLYSKGKAIMSLLKRK